MLVMPQFYGPRIPWSRRTRNSHFDEHHIVLVLESFSAFFEEDEDENEDGNEEEDEDEMVVIRTRWQCRGGLGP